MKKNVILLLVCMMGLSSCFGDSYNEMTGTVVLDFSNFPDESKDSLFFGYRSRIYIQCFALVNAYEGSGLDTDTDEATELVGGFGMSSRLVRWNLADTPETEDAVALTEDNDTPYVNDNLFMSVFQPIDNKVPAANSYAVFYYSDELKEGKHHISFVPKDDGEWTPKSCMIANTAYTIACAYNRSEDLQDYTSFTFNKYQAPGEGVAEKEGDWIRIVAQGYKDGADAMTGQAEIYLVDYKDGQQDSVMTAWKPLDLSKLGEVDYIDFVVECSDALKNGEKKFPVYFCIDDVVSSVHLKY